MKFIFGLLIGGGLVFGWYYMQGSSKAELGALNKELLQTRADLVAANAKLANTVETVYVSPRLEQMESKSVVVTVPVRPAPQSVSVPQQSVPVAPVKSGLGGPRPVAGGARVRQ